MAAETPFRITPSLGPDLHQSETQYYWDSISAPTTTPSYQLGSVVRGNDGYEYIFVKAAAGFAALDGLSVNTTTWLASADASAPVFVAPVAVLIDEYFHARRVDLFA